jgi:branched-chain amino acid transport system permease protein
MTGDRRVKRLVSAAPAIVLIVVALVLPQTMSDFRLGQMTGWITLAVAALGLNLLTGYNGQISIGHGALYGIGAYTCGLLITKAHWAMGWSVLAAAVVCFVVGILIGLPALRITGLYLALVTLAVAVVFPSLVTKYSSFTGGGRGLYITTPQLNSRGVTVPKTVQLLSPSWLHESPAQWTFYVFVIVAVVCFVIVRNVVNSRVGRSIIAIRDNEVAAEVNGVNVAAVKVLTFGVSAALAGIGGALFALWQGQLFPSSLMLSVSLYLLVAVVVGGPASIIGPALGAVFVGFFQDIITPDLPSRIRLATPLILGVLLIALMLAAPGGLVGLARQLVARVQVSRSGSGTSAVDAPEPPPQPA